MKNWVRGLWVAMMSVLVATDPFDRVYPIQAVGVTETLYKRAKSIQRNLGTRSAAGFLRNRGIDLGSALQVLAGSHYMRV